MVATVTVATNPFGVAITPNGAFAYVSSFGNTVSVIDTSSNTVVATVTVGPVPKSLAIGPTIKRSDRSIPLGSGIERLF